MELGIVGLPNAGKSTLFNALTKAGAGAANYPYSTITPNVGIVNVPDERLYRLGELFKSKKIIEATIKFVDIAGLAKGASRGEGLGNQFLSHIRDVDAIVHVLRLFEDENVIHPDGSIDPLRDIENLDLELIFADLEVLERRIQKLGKAAKNDKALMRQESLLGTLKAHLEEGNSVRSFGDVDEEDAEFIKSLNLLTAKPVIFAANVALEDLDGSSVNNPHAVALRAHAASVGSEIFFVCAQIEQEMVEFSDEEKLLFMAEMGVEKSGLDLLIQASYRLLGLISFLTTGPDETRAWTVKGGSKAPQAAGKIHYDMERGFIRAEVVGYDDLVAQGSFAAAKEKGLVGIEGKEYTVREGDVIVVRFNV